MGISDYRNHPRQLVGLLRTGLGRLVVLGSGRECLADALARGNGSSAQHFGYGKARCLSQLDLTAGYFGILSQPLGYLLSAFRSADLCSRLCQ